MRHKNAEINQGRGTYKNVRILVLSDWLLLEKGGATQVIYV